MYIIKRFLIFKFTFRPTEMCEGHLCMQPVKFHRWTEVTFFHTYCSNLKQELLHMYLQFVHSCQGSDKPESEKIF